MWIVCFKVPGKVHTRIGEVNHPGRYRAGAGGQAARRLARYSAEGLPCTPARLPRIQRGAEAGARQGARGDKTGAQAVARPPEPTRR
jgi:hypothetical protein